MCGIVGYLGPEPHPPISLALAKLAHRGPDDQYQLSRSGLSLGARRLAIIDVEGGRQPISNEDGTVVAAQNGEIYNYVELRVELQRAGHRFRTYSDTEVLVHAWEEWGTDCVHHFRGMFALAIYDERNRTLFLARDRFGIKPLYMWEGEGTLAFASELPALLSLLPERPALNTARLAPLLEFGWVPGPSTLWDGVESLAPAHYRLITSERDDRVRYWQLPLRPERDLLRPHDWLDQLDEILSESVRLRLRADVPVGALLSGGIDSSLLVATMHRSGHENIHTFNIGFDDSDYDETRYAMAVAAQFPVAHHTIHFQSSAFDRLPEITRIYGQPVGSGTHIAIWLLYLSCAAAGLKVILTGEGADELFGGYPWYRGSEYLSKAFAYPWYMREALAFIAPYLGISSPARSLLTRSRFEVDQAYQAWSNPHAGSLARHVLTDDARAESSLAFSLEIAQEGVHLQHQLTYLDWQSRLPDFINLEVDRMSMAHGVEARVPFLDHRLWETVLSWQPAVTWWGEPAKSMLRKLGKRCLPQVVTRRQKQGLASPHAQWWRQSVLPDWAESILTPNSLNATGLFKSEAISQLRDQQRRGIGNYATTLTAVLTTQLWLLVD